MRSPADSRRLAELGLWIALAAALQAAETLVATPVPWFRLGLGNALVLVALHRGGARDGAWVALGKVFLGGLLAGRLFGPGFLLSLVGAAAAVVVMGLALRGSPPLGFVGLSVLGATAHALAQVALASTLLLQSPALWSLAPFLVLLALATGCVTGLVAHRIAAALEARPP